MVAAVAARTAAIRAAKSSGGEARSAAARPPCVQHNGRTVLSELHEHIHTHTAPWLPQPHHRVTACRACEQPKLRTVPRGDG